VFCLAECDGVLGFCRAGEVSVSDAGVGDAVARDLVLPSTEPARCSNPEGMHLLAAESATLDCRRKEVALSLNDGVVCGTDFSPFVLQEDATSMILGPGDVGFENDLNVEVR
jgi:hypothetical protein